MESLMPSRSMRGRVIHVLEAKAACAWSSIDEQSLWTGDRDSGKMYKNQPAFLSVVSTTISFLNQSSAKTRFHNDYTSSYSAT